MFIENIAAIALIFGLLGLKNWIVHCNFMDMSPITCSLVVYGVYYSLRYHKDTILYTGLVILAVSFFLRFLMVARMDPDHTMVQEKRHVWWYVCMIHMLGHCFLYVANLFLLSTHPYREEEDPVYGTGEGRRPGS